MKAELERLLDHMLWADARVASSLEEVPAGHRAREIYAHVLGAEQIWLARIRDEEDGPVWPVSDEATLMPLRDLVRDGYRSVLRLLGEDELGRIVSYRNSAGESFETPLIDVLLHVFLHGAYHRGQVALLLRGDGHVPEPSDFIAFVRGAPAATRDDRDPWWRDR